MTEEKKVSEMSPEEIKNAVRETYSRVAESKKSDKATTSSCCGSQSQISSSDSMQTA